MNIDSRVRDGIRVVQLGGRMDGFGAKEAAAALPATDDPAKLVVDGSEMSYLSSAGVRVLLGWQKAAAAAGGAFALCGLQPFCRSVLEMSGLAGMIPVFDTVDEAVEELRVHSAGGNVGETVNTDAGTFEFHPVSGGGGTIDILGDIAYVLDCVVTEDLVADKPFFETEYSLGLGALGARPQDYLPVMGEAIMLAGTMVWLPTDGNDTPDYMIPRKASTDVVLRTAFNASLRGGFNEFAVFRAKEGKPASIRDIYRAVFDLAPRRRHDYRGVLGLVMRAEIHEAFGAGIVKSPLLENQPANGLPITDPSNFPEWFESDRSPRHAGTTALVCGVGADLTADLSGIDGDRLERMFYVNPANLGSQSEVLHNHAVFFTGAPPPVGGCDMDAEMRRVVEGGEFADMRHLLDQTTVVSALIAVSYVQEVREDRNV